MIDRLRDLEQRLNAQLTRELAEHSANADDTEATHQEVMRAITDYNLRLPHLRQTDRLEVWCYGDYQPPPPRSSNTTTP